MFNSNQKYNLGFNIGLLSSKYSFANLKGFNGMESDDEVKGVKNSYDFGARIYDPRVGRWLSRDPLEAKYAPIAPYVFALNNPLVYVDPDGRDVDPVIHIGFDWTGTFTSIGWGEGWNRFGRTEADLFGYYNYKTKKVETSLKIDIYLSAQFDERHKFHEQFRKNFQRKEGNLFDIFFNLIIEHEKHHAVDFEEYYNNMTYQFQGEQMANGRYMYGNGIELKGAADEILNEIASMERERILKLATDDEGNYKEGWSEWHVDFAVDQLVEKAVRDMNSQAKAHFEWKEEEYEEKVKKQTKLGEDYLFKIIMEGVPYTTGEKNKMDEKPSSVYSDDKQQSSGN